MSTTTSTTTDSHSDGTRELIGTGRNVLQVDAPVDGRTVWLETPQAVLDFVSKDECEGVVVVVRGGTTTFLTPALSAGIAGVVTLQGAPESHLGIVCREFGIPCVMSVAFTRGIRAARGEVVPPDGTPVQLHLSGARSGEVTTEPGLLSEPGEASAEGGLDEAGRAEVERLLANFQGEVPPGDEGNEVMEARMDTRVLYLDDEDDLRRDLVLTEVRDIQRYWAWAEWDALAARATEGESGLIPRQEYEALGFLNFWLKSGDLVRAITDRVGVDGVVDIGRRIRTEVGTKINLLHAFAVGTAAGFGRGIAVDRGLQLASDDARDLADVQQFARRIYKGHWGGGATYTAQRRYSAPVLGPEWADRFAAHRIPLDDPEALRAFQKFNGSSELLGFLVHFDNRCGLGDSGPYPTPDGGFVLVRDHILHETAYHWSDVAEDLPYAITQAMYFPPGTPLEVQLLDLGTTFTRPANYLQYLTGVAVFARDRWDSPMSELRPLGVADMQSLETRCRAAADRLYRRIARMSRRDKIMAGSTVYTADFLLPYARAAGIYDELVERHDLHELHPTASAAYYEFVDGRAAEMMPRLFLTGKWCVPAETLGVDDPADYPLLHALALRGVVPGDGSAAHTGLVTRGLATETRMGLTLSDSGRAAHERLLQTEQTATDLEGLGSVYKRFLRVNTEFKGLAARWRPDGDDTGLLLSDLEDLLERTDGVLDRAAALVERFADHRTRMQGAWSAVQAGNHEFVTSPRVESLHNIWMEVHEDFVQLLSIDREEEGSF